MAELLVDMDPCSLRPGDYRKVMKEYIEAYESPQIRQLLEAECGGGSDRVKDVGAGSGPSKEKIGQSTDQFAFNVSAVDLVASDSSLAFSVMHHPSLLLPLFNEAVVEAEVAALRVLTQPSSSQSQTAPSRYSVKLKVNVRIHTLPPVSHFCRHSIGQIR